MPRRFDCNRGKNSLAIQTDCFIDNIFIASFEPVVHAAEFCFNKFLQSARCNGIRNDCRPWMFFNRNCCNQGNNPVPVDLPTGSVHSSCPVHIRIEDYAEIRVLIDYSLLNRRHSRLILGIRDMIRKTSVRIQELTPFCTCAKRFQYLVCIKTPGSISSIYNDPKTFQRLLFSCFVSDLAHNIRGIYLYEINCSDFPQFSCPCIDFILCKFQNFRDIPFLQSAVFCKKLQSIPVER